MDREAGTCSSSSNRPWTSGICPLVDFGFACLVLVMTVYFFVTRMTQLCSSLASCWTGGAHREDGESTSGSRNQQLSRHSVEVQSNSICVACQRQAQVTSICSCCIMKLAGSVPRMESSKWGLLDSSGTPLIEACVQASQKLSVLIQNLHHQDCSCSSQPGSDQQLEHKLNHRLPAHDMVAEGEELKKSRESAKAELEGLYYELEEERSAAAVAASESIAMITRLQEEKAALLMEARQYQRMVEEQAFEDHKAINVLKEMLFKREAEKLVLEEEIELYKSSPSTVPGTSHKDGEPTTLPETSNRNEARKKSSSEDETSATIKAVEEERLSVLERVRRLEQQLQLLRSNKEIYKKRACAPQPVV